MPTHRLKVADLLDLEGQVPGAQTPDVVVLTALVVKRFGFLPKPVTVHVEGDEVGISYPEEPGQAQAEAKQLADKAAKRAQEGNYSKAIDIYIREKTDLETGDQFPKLFPDSVFSASSFHFGK